MTKYMGPCDRCGEHLERDIRPGRRKYHLECGIAAAAEQNIAMANGTHPGAIKSKEVGRQMAAQIKKRQGKLYDRWAEGMARYLDALDTTE